VRSVEVADKTAEAIAVKAGQEPDLTDETVEIGVLPLPSKVRDWVFSLFGD
jgi:hypothetical protein